MRWKLIGCCCGLSSLSCLPGAAPTFTDRTPARADYSPPMNAQLFQADVVASRNRTLSSVSVEVGGKVSPMDPTGSTYAFSMLVPACTQVLTYRYAVWYMSEGDMSGGESFSFPENGWYTRSFDHLPASCATMPPAGGGRVFYVDTLADGVDATPGDGVCSATGGGCTLRAAVMEANASPTRDVIILNGGRHVLTLTGTETPADVDAKVLDLDITESVVISGTCPPDVGGFLDPATNPPYGDRGSTGYASIDAGGRSRVLDIHPASAAVEVGLRCVHVTGGALLNATATTDRWGGAGIYNAGALTLEKVAVTHNRQTGVTSGTGIHNAGTLVLKDSVVLHNKGETAGAAFGGTSGGGVFNDTGATATVERSTIGYNEAARGSAILSFGTTTIVNSTITNNSSSDGVASAIFQDGGHLHAAWSTFVANGMPIGQSSPDATVESSIIEGTCSGAAPVSRGGNWVKTASCVATLNGTYDVVSTKYVIRETLQSLGGFAPTLRSTFYPGSDATLYPLDRRVLGLTPCPAVDQRGFGRPVDANGDGTAVCDLGAFEWQAGEP